MKACHGSAFTLIELLIVVAIIAILALIAVPNFLEAQTRAKVSRVKNDMRTIATAWEAYHVDWNCYPRDQDNRLWHSSQFGLRQVTTPIAYITSPPMDPFYSGRLMPDNEDYAGSFEIASAVATSEPYDCFYISSIGPDYDDDCDGNNEWPAQGDALAYDPTNGTVSDGDILRFGGQYRIGVWSYCGVPYQQWGSFGN